MMLPVTDPKVSQEYGRINSNYRKGYHTGIDLVASPNDKMIYNVAPGTVIRARYSSDRKGADPSGWGNYVIVRQDDGLDVLYAHLYQVFASEGQRVTPGDSIGIQGSTGNVTGPHLHFEIWNGSWTDRNDINPADYLGIKNVVGKVELLEKLELEKATVRDSYFGIDYEAIYHNGKTYVELRPFAPDHGIPILDWDNEKRIATVGGGLVEGLNELIEKYKKGVK